MHETDRDRADRYGRLLDRLAVEMREAAGTGDATRMRGVLLTLAADIESRDAPEAL